MTNAVHHSLHYIELPSKDNAAMKAFYGAVFGWTFENWGPNYVAIHGAGVEGGFDMESDRKPTNQGALIIVYSKDLKASEQAVRDAGGVITQTIFSFPGGSRFHFNDPSGNNLGVWTMADS
jgi:predicted enzyme related to lactoylglutathione lyase